MESRSEFQAVRRKRVHVRRWGTPGAPLLVMLHGWRENSATFQFLVDALQDAWDIVAPDWPGFGLSDWKDEYFHSGYAADLDVLLRIYSPDAPARLVGHSMGAAVAVAYLGARPQRVRCLVNLDGLAPVPLVSPAHQLKLLGNWLDEATEDRQPQRFASREEFTRVLMSKNPRLTPERARFLAVHFARPVPGGGLELLADPAQLKLPTPPVFSHEAMERALQQFPRPVLWITGGRSKINAGMRRLPGAAEILQRRIAAAPDSRHFNLPEAGHNVHHDEPERVAECMGLFLAGLRV